MVGIPSLDKQQALAAGWTAERRTLALILAVLALRFFFATATGLGVDESYTVATSRVLTLSTFDHPPLAWWIAHAAGRLLGESALALRAPFVLLSGLTGWLTFLLTRRLFSAESGFYAVFALALSPAFADAMPSMKSAPGSFPLTASALSASALTRFQSSALFAPPPITFAAAV
jgi:hypothetical protein